MKPSTLALAAVTSATLLGLAGFVAFPALSAPGTDVTTYAGLDKLNGNLVVNYSESREKTSFYAYHVPLNQQQCPGQYTTLFLNNIDVTDDSFDQFDGVNGVNGTYEQNDEGNPAVTGTIYVNQGDPCANSVPYIAETMAALQGDYDCSWRTLFETGNQPQGPAPIPDPLDGINLDDVLNYLKSIAGARTPTPSPTSSASPAPACPKPDTTTPAGVVSGDSDCDGKTSTKDVLHVINLELGIDPTPAAGPHCVRVGHFYLLDK